MHQTPYIIKAVNMHDDLISTIKECHELLVLLKISHEFSNLVQYDINKCIGNIKKLLIKEDNADE